MTSTLAENGRSVESAASAGSELRRPVASVLLSWLAMIGVDFVLHAGLLAPLYDWGSPFLLSPEQAFARIPIGYLSFLVLATGLVWLLVRLEVTTGRQGAQVAGAAGAVIWGAFVVGLWSISTASLSLLLGWWLGQTAELAIGGYVVGSIAGGARTRTIALRVGALIVLGALAAVALQVAGYATPPVIAG